MLISHTIQLLRSQAILRVSTILLLTAVSSMAGQVSSAPADRSGSAMANWWNGKNLTGNWFGARDVLADRGLTFSGKWEGDFFGILDSRSGSRGSFDQEINFKGDVDVAKLTGFESLAGLTAFGEVRYRQPLSPSADPATFIGASSMFNPAHYQGGTQWRLTHFGIGYTTPQLFGIKDLLSLRGGWLQPSKEFLIQPLAQLFVNNAINSARGIGGNIQWTSSYSSWGGTLLVKPTGELYAKGGLFLAMPQGANSANHGLAYSGYARDPRQNGLMAVSEIGYTPKFSGSKLPGKYAAGGYYFGVDTVSSNGTPVAGQYGFYFQADQMLYREPSAEAPAPLAKGPSDGKSFKAPVAPEAPKLNEQGLSSFTMLTFAPNYVLANKYPFYFQTGLAYKGLVPTRDKDQTLLALGYGNYNSCNIEILQAKGVANQPNYTMVLEGGYRIQLNDWAYFQPFVQYLIQPNGTGAVQNATVLGFSTAVLF